ncbi:sodium:solute symporter [Sulfitobacter sp. M57]|uniref:sensor histidine kinase n=1 Tax=unclassified Sulfitobacter TaxID=196795 RepID=UPI0023E25CA5|nr:MULTISPECIES: sensor histidine kinase [unclassified Sulfitobacter]MDF3413412.1 sodium:solute symporter [Sulfitobacter sp. KE5]MDF3421308.1 sodium:solute symporter [Sulfitobacter sp. KE43]MDF3431959.1 sodium:solute symporter [Sulfitobacter sp. KE42]MDF3457599.1 sodium:solute symporter [Sulfitobacter sp. S74]MDF3461501.1 sodium:solute symporter [Sulfitobacter sp. Ks18]
MSVGINQLIFVCLAYVVFLFVVAFLAERASARGRFAAILRSPLVYTLSLSIYCTAWTFYGAVGYAARSGLEYLTIYLGPSLVMIGWWWILRRLVSIGRSQRVTSIADLISSRYGKSNALAIVVTLMAVIGVTPYIALQLQSVVLSFSIFATSDGGGGQGLHPIRAAFWVAMGLALFTVLFGTRNLNVNERHHGIVIAVAVEAVVKLVALLAVGIFVVWGLAGGLTEMLARIDASDIGEWEVQSSRWATLTLLSAAAFLCLPRMFQVMVVENDDDRSLQIASWAFPAYLMLMSLFVVPIAVVGLDLLPAGSNPDLFVLSLPLSQNQNGLAMLSFLGGFSSATSMVIVATLALSTMVSNHIIMPVWLALRQGGAAQSGDVRGVIIQSRRFCILLVIALGFLYYRASGGSGALAAIGTISFGGVAQFLPALLGGIFWRGATRTGAFCGLGTGFALWVFTMLLPSFGIDVALSKETFDQGLLGAGWLRPRALFGIEGLDPTVHAVVWSLSLNTLVFTVISIFSFPEPVERLQGAQFVNVTDHAGPSRVWTASVAGSEDLMIMSQRIMGAAEAQAFFRKQTQAQGLSGHLPEPTPAFIEALERELAASVGAATAHAMVGQIVGGSSISVQDLLAVADESAQMLEYSSQLEQKSRELSVTAAQLRAANEKLTQLSLQKDGFLSQISHELRTPMTSIRSFSEILRDTGSLSEADKTRYASIIHAETIRLTRLLDDLLDLSVLENGQVSLHLGQEPLHAVLERAVTTVVSGGEEGLHVRVAPQETHVVLNTDLDRLVQVFINLISNARKYCQAETPELTITPRLTATGLTIDFVDNGKGIAGDEQAVVFEKFYRVGGSQGDGAGLGLAICQEIMERLGGKVRYLAGMQGGAFQVTLPHKALVVKTVPSP